MNLSLKRRVALSFIITNIVILTAGAVVYSYLNSLNKEVEILTTQTNDLIFKTDQIRISAVQILKYQRRLLTTKNSQDLVDKIINKCETFTEQIKEIDSYYTDAEIKKVIAQMLGYVDSLKVVLSKASLYSRDSLGLSTISDLADKILESFSTFQEIQMNQSKKRDEKIQTIIKETKRNMMITIIISFLGTILLNLVIPGKIALPFKKIKDAIRELQDCNFDVSIFYSQDDEIGEISREMNKMIHSIKKFDELRADRVNVEKRKFDVLANMVKRPVLVANAAGKIVYMNNQLYSLMQIQSDDVIGKELAETVMPPTVVESFELAIKRRSKIENTEIIIPAKITEEEAESKDIEVVVEEKEVVEGEEPSVEPGKEEVEVEVEVAYKGFANVVPIRGRDSSLDYYLMVLSKEVFK
ncbi:MAG: PAS domain-containing protein [Bacteriovoracaceae bacterium]